MSDSGDQAAGTTFSLVRYNNPVVIDKEETISRPKSAPASTGNIKCFKIMHFIKDVYKFYCLSSNLVIMDLSILWIP